MPPHPPFSLALLPLFALLLTLLPTPTTAQQVGSFFTAIYLNGAVVSSSQTSCADMGQSSYCCGAGTSCAWDDSGKVACCAAGTNCQGSAYGAGANNNAGQYYTSSTSTWQPQPQSTWAQSEECGHCNNGGGTSYGNGNVVPIVPITQATVLTSYTPVVATTTSYAQQPVTTTVTPAVEGNAVVTSSGKCNGAYSTIVEANVGQPTRTVGCYVLINGASKVKGAFGREHWFALWGLASTTLMIGWLW